MNIQSNGSEQGNRFVKEFREIEEKDIKASKDWVEFLVLYGISAAHPEDGWVDRQNNGITLMYPLFIKNEIEIGNLIAIGNVDNFRIVKVVGIRHGSEFTLAVKPKYYFVEMYFNGTRFVEIEKEEAE